MPRAWRPHRRAGARHRGRGATGVVSGRRVCSAGIQVVTLGSARLPERGPVLASGRARLADARPTARGSRPVHRDAESEARGAWRCRRGSMRQAQRRIRPVLTPARAASDKAAMHRLRMAMQCIDPAPPKEPGSRRRSMRVLTAIVVTGLLGCGSARTGATTSPEPVVERVPEPPRRPPPPAVERGESSSTVEGRSTTTETHIRVEQPTPPASEPTPDASPASSCCRMCRKGKACGNTCIARNEVCRTPPGCACDE